MYKRQAYIAQMDQKIKEQVTFAPEIPWLERETQVLYKLNRTLAVSYTHLEQQS